MTVSISYYPTASIPHEALTYAVIIAKYNDQWLLVQHKARNTWEIPGGHIEPAEQVDDAAKRELFEETGAVDFSLSSVCDYSVTLNGVTKHGRLYAADIKVLGALPESEIAKVKTFSSLPENLSYPNIQPELLARYLNIP